MIRIVRKPRLTTDRRRTTLWLDTGKLDRARQLLGTRGVRETIDRALDEVAAIAGRRRLADRLRRMEGLDLDDEKVIAEAWR